MDVSRRDQIDAMVQQLRARFGRPEEVADGYACPASDGAGHVNGAVIGAAGGLTV